jgi:hypothetical protein
LRLSVRRSLAGLLALLGALAAGSAHAYNYASPFADGCHEGLSVDALLAVRERSSAARALPTSPRDRVWIDDLPLALPPEARDLGAATLIAGVRDNDVKGLDSLDVGELALVHGHPNAQREHCLRRSEHDEPAGTQQALAECRDYILERFELAVRNGFDAHGEVDPEARTTLAIDLDIAGPARVPMPTAYLELGHALHTLQDSFSHAIRSEDGLRVRVLLNWIDYTDDHLDSTRDGPAHRAGLDKCTGLDALRRQRLQRAAEASHALVRAAFRLGRSPEEKIEDARALLDRYLSFEEGCGRANDYCDAPELRYSVSSMACGIVPGGAEGREAGVAWVVAIVLVALGIRGRRRVPWHGVGALVLTLTSARVSAQGTGTDLASDVACYDVSGLAARGGISASVDEAGAALAAGARYGVSPHWLFGLDAEWNPWFSLETGRVRGGVLNVYATLVWRSPVSPALALRVSGHAGFSTLLFDMYGAPSGSVGPYLGVSLLGLEVRLQTDLAVVLDPADVVVMVPHSTGIPYIRRQYRATVSLELRL